MSTQERLEFETRNNLDLTALIEKAKTQMLSDIHLLPTINSTKYLTLGVDEDLKAKTSAIFWNAETWRLFPNEKSKYITESSHLFYKILLSSLLSKEFPDLDVLLTNRFSTSLINDDFDLVIGHKLKSTKIISPLLLVNSLGKPAEKDIYNYNLLAPTVFLPPSVFIQKEDFHGTIRSFLDDKDTSKFLDSAFLNYKEPITFSIQNQLDFPSNLKTVEWKKEEILSNIPDENISVNEYEISETFLSPVEV